jgi:transcription elongation factor Elf1
MNKWGVCKQGKGYLFKDNIQGKFETNFGKDAVGVIKEERGEYFLVWLIGSDSHWIVSKNEVEGIDVTKTGDKFDFKICNVCHCLKPTENFAKNQNNLHGTVRRPSCQKCRTSIDKRAPKTKQAKQMEKQKPKKGELFTCPICRKRSIVGVTAKIVADHDHHTGNIRGFICDSCNTGLGRFKNGENYLMNAVNYINDHDVLG